MQLNRDEVQRIVLMALSEDIGHGDITTQATIPDHIDTTLQFVAREALVVAGLPVLEVVFGLIDPVIDVQFRVSDGEQIAAGTVIASVLGDAHPLLAAERVALNLLQRMCGIATETAAYVQAISGTKAKILDTRKTVPGLRELDKYAVRCGGGHNHRMRLDDAVLIKDNHIAIVGSVGEAVTRAKANTPATIRVEVECDTLDQVHEALKAEADMILLDNMNIDQLREAVNLVAGRALCEASGNVSRETVAQIAQTGVDFISVGKLTHSVRAADIGLDHVLKG